MEDGILEIKQAFELGQLCDYRNPFYSNVSFLKQRGHVNAKNELNVKVIAAFARGASRSMKGDAPLTTNQKLRFAVMCDRAPLLEWQSRCIQSLVGSGLCELAVAIVARNSPTASGYQLNGSDASSGSLAFRIYSRRVFKRSVALRVADADKQLDCVPRISCEVTRSTEGRRTFQQGDLKRIRDADLDFILKFDSGCLSGGILEVTRFGLWSFDPTGIAGHPEVPTAFWEVHDGNPVSQAMLFRLAEAPRAAVLLYNGFFPTVTFSWRHNLDRVLLRVTEWPLRVCRDILNGCASYLNRDPEPLSVPALANPTNWQTANTFLSMGAAFIKTQLQNVLIRDQWHVGVVRAPISSFVESADQPDVEWLPDLPRNRFFSDPFAIKRGNEIVILFEDFDQHSSRGVISAVRSTDNGRTFSEATPVTGSVFNAPVHKAYPFLLEYQGSIYCVPETCEAGEIALYRAVDFPLKWERVCPLLEGAGGIDATPFEYQGRWWMFYATQEGGSNLKLYLASAPQLEGPWAPHPQNPLKTDIGSARPAGTPFMHNGALYRPAQDSTRTYGGGIVIHRVVKLTATEFEETPVRRIAPARHGRYSAGFHTLAAAGDICVVDGKRLIAVPELLPKMIASKVASMARTVWPFKAK